MLPEWFSKIFHVRDLVIIPVIYVCFCTFLFLFQKKLIYHPDSRAFESCKYFHLNEMIRENGFRGYIRTTTSKKWAVIYHGNAGNACDRSFYVDILSNHGYSVLLVEYPGYAEDRNPPSLKKILGIVPDVARFVETLSPERIVIIGESLGSGVAAYHAKTQNLDRLVLITPFDSILNVAKKQFRFFPVRWILTENFDTLDWAKDTPSVRILAAENDEVIPNTHAQNLFHNLSTSDKKIAMINAVGHNTIFDSPTFVDALTRSCND